MFTLGLVFVILGFALFGTALVRVLRANAGRRVPYGRRPDVQPAGTVVTRTVGAGLIVAGTVLFSTPHAVWWVAFPVALLGLVALAIFIHNVRAAETNTRSAS